MKKSNWRLIGLATLLAVAAKSGAADEPKPWQIDFQAPISEVAQDIYNFHNFILLPLELALTLFVLILMGYICWRFSAKRNPVPSKTTHHTVLEVVWTAIPIVILIPIGWISMNLLFFMDKAQDPEMTLKIIGHQWFWSYEYPDHGKFTFDSNIIPKEELKPGQPRLLAVDNHVVLPVDTTIRILFTSDDVIHAWALPAAGVKLDNVPGRINESWMSVPNKFAGRTYYGQCSELCGVNHGFMPIAVDFVSKADFKIWVEKAKKEFAGTTRPQVEIARNTVARP